jgi:hypothetical protein
MIVYESDLKRMAISAMENCMAYLKAGDMMRAHQYYGEARAYEDMLEDEGFNLEAESEHFAEMKVTYWNKTSRIN